MKSSKSTILFTILFWMGLVWLFREDKTKTILTFDPFTGLSSSGVSGASGKLFRGEKCREWTGSRDVKWKNEPSMKPIDTKQMCENWVVITSINPPTEAMQVFDTWDDWCTVIVFDHKTPVEQYNALKRVKVLTVEEQLKMESHFKSLKIIPWNHFGRKNVGYLYAIMHGARVIYDTDDDNIPIRKISLDERLMTMESKSGFYNPYRHFLNESEDTVWPRGFPLDEIRKDVNSKCCGYAKTTKVGVRQYLAQHDPDVDAIYRLTSRLPLQFRTDTVSVTLQPETFSPYNAQATLHNTEAFFGLLLPISVHGRVSDIWRSYFVQKLLWLTGSRIAFMSPLVIQKRNVHNYLADFDSEIPLYIKSTRLIEYLGNWRSLHKDIRSVTRDLAIGMYEHCYWEEKDVALVTAWLEDLSSVGYSFPAVVPDTIFFCDRILCPV